MIILNTDEIISLHSKIVERTGGGDGIRDINLLESAIYSASASCCGSDAYPTILIEFSLGAADNKFGYDEILEWIRFHK